MPCRSNRLGIYTVSWAWLWKARFWERARARLPYSRREWEAITNGNDNGDGDNTPLNSSPCECVCVCELYAPPDWVSLHILVIGVLCALQALIFFDHWQAFIYAYYLYWLQGWNKKKTTKKASQEQQKPPLGNQITHRRIFSSYGVQLTMNIVYHCYYAYFI